MFASLHLYQLVILAVAAFMIYQGVERFLKHENGQTIWKIAVRIIVWGGMVAIALFPSLSNILASLIGIEGNINAVILTGFFLVFLMIFKLLSAIERLEQQISCVIRKESLDDMKEIVKR